MRTSTRSLGSWFCLLWLLVAPGWARGATGTPTIQQQPESQSVVSGSNVTLAVTADGTSPLRYQWRFKGFNISGATNASLVLPSISFTQAGVYTVFISNPLGSVLSEPALLQVDPHMTFRITSLRTNGAMVVDHNALTGVDRPGLAVSSNSVFVNGATATARFNAETLTGGQSVGRRYEAFVADLRTEKVYALAFGTNLIGSGGGIVDTLYEINSLTGALTTNRIVLSTNVPAQNFGDVGLFSGYGRIVIHIGYRAYNIDMPSGKVTDLGSASYLNHNYSSTWAYWGIAEYVGGRIYLVYAQYAFPDVRYIARTLIPEYAPSSIAASFNDMADLASIAFSPSLSRWFFHYEGSGQLGGFPQTLGSAKALYTTDSRFPVIYAEPQYQSPYPGSNAVFTVHASSELPLSYQWLFNGTNIAGATNATLVVSNVSTNEEGFYSVTVSNSVGVALSTEAQLAMITTPVIYQDPTSRTVYPGANVTFFAFADGAPPLAYQWFYNGQEIGDATNSTLVLTNVQVLQEGAYSFSISNQFGHVFSDAATLTVIGEPFIVAAPANRSINIGGNASFAVTADGAPPLRYQWQFHGTNLASATNRTLNITNAQPSMAGSYTIVVSNLYGTVSASATLDVITVPSIVTNPASQSVVQGEPLTLEVSAVGPGPLYYQWRLNGSNLSGQTNRTLVIENFQANDAGTYTVLVQNSFGALLSAPAVLSLFPVHPEGASFRIASLTANNFRILEHPNVTGDDRGGIAVSLDTVFVTGDSSTARFGFGLTNGTSINQRLDGLASNLRNGKIYVLSSNEVPVQSGAGSMQINRLLEVDGRSGQLTGKQIPLSQPIPMFVNSSLNGVFSGYDRIVLHNNTNTYHISLPSGVVSNLGSLTISQRRTSESWAYWGVAENFGGSLYLVYARSATEISRTRVPDGQTTTLATFSGLGDMASFTVALYTNRWYFHYENGGQFGGSDEVVGYASATFDINPVGTFEWGPIEPVQLLDSPFTVTITAKTPLNAVATTFNGPATLRGTNAAGGGLVTIVPTVTGNFTNGVWSGQVRVLQSSAGMYLQAANSLGSTGLSDQFRVLPTNDISVVVMESPDPVPATTPLIYSILVTNTGPLAASGVRLTNQLSSNVVFQSVSSSQGSCSNDAGIIRCELGAIAGRDTAFVTIEVVPSGPGSVTNRVGIGRAELDSNLTNNSVTTVTLATLPFVTIADASVAEGNSGTNQMVFNVTLYPSSTNTVRVNFVTSSSGASSGSDFVFRSGNVTFAPGETNLTISIPVLGDGTYETNETFSVQLSAAVNGYIARNPGVGTILNDDSIPVLTVSNPSITEGNSGTNNLAFVFELSGRSGLPVTVSYATSDGSASAGPDYLARSGTLVFAANTSVLTQTVLVPVRGDTLGESNETFFVNILTVSNAVSSQAAAIGTILGDDGIGVLHHFAISMSGTQHTVNVPVPVTISARDFFGNTVSNYEQTVNLQAGIGTSPALKNILADRMHTDSFAGDFTLGYGFTPHQDLTVTAVRHYVGTKVSVWTTGGRLVLSVPVVSVFGLWLETPLPQPVTLLEGESYIVAYYSGGDSGLNPFGSSEIPNTFEDGTVTNNIYVSGDGFPINDLNGGGYFFADLVYFTGLGLQPVAFTPTNTTSFVNGSWNGAVTFLEPGNGVKLFAGDGAGHQGESGPFHVQGTGGVNLGLSAVIGTNAAPVGSNLVLHLTVTNRGPGAASGILLSNLLPAGFQFVTAAVGQGTWSNASGQVWIRFENIPNGGAVTAALTVVPTLTGNFTNHAGVSGEQNDPAPWNNSSALTLTVYRDTDGDGMWDDWERNFGLNETAGSDAGTDSDLDGLSNLEEFLAGTHPGQAQSVLRINRATILQGNVHIRFEGVSGKKYRLERRPLPGGDWTSVVEFKVGLSREVELIDSTGAVGGIYRIRLVQ